MTRQVRRSWSDLPPGTARVLLIVAGMGGEQGLGEQGCPVAQSYLFSL